MDAKDNGPRGVGGLLALLVVVMVVIEPLTNIGGIYGAIASAERQSPILARLAEWSSYKTYVWTVTLVVCAIGIYGGVGLATKRTPDAVFRAKIILWLVGPVAGFLVGILIPVVTGSASAKEAAGGFPLLIASVIAAAIWTAYLNRSKRVKNTYGIGGTPLMKTAPPWKADGFEASSAKLAAGSNLTSPPSLRSPVTPAATTHTNPSRAPARSKPENRASESPQDLEDRVYAVIGKELESASTDSAAWTKAFAQAGGDDKQTRVQYIKLRFDKLMAVELQRVTGERLARGQAFESERRTEYSYPLRKSLSDSHA